MLDKTKHSIDIVNKKRYYYIYFLQRNYLSNIKRI